jgi:hypothetical protein
VSPELLDPLTAFSLRGTPFFPLFGEFCFVGNQSPLYRH